MSDPNPNVNQAAQASGVTTLRTPPKLLDPGPPRGLTPKRFVDPINPPTAMDPKPAPQKVEVHPLQVPQVSVMREDTPGRLVQSLVGASVAPTPAKKLGQGNEGLDLIDQEEVEESVRRVPELPGEHRVPQEILDRFKRVDFHSTAMIAILSKGFGFSISRLVPEQQLLLRGRVTEAFNHVLNDRVLLGNLFSRIKDISQSIWSDRKIGNIIAGMIVSSGLEAYLKNGLLDD